MDIGNTRFIDRVIVVQIQNVNLLEPKAAIQDPPKKNELLRSRADALATRPVKLKVVPAVWAHGKTVQWTFTPMGRQKGSLPKGRSNLEKYPGFNFEAKTNRSIVNANGSLVVRVNMPPHGFNEGTLRCQLIGKGVPPCQKSLVFNVPAVVVVDPGHGGKDPGAVNSTTNTEEADIVLAVGALVQAGLAAEPDVSVHMTRDKDVSVALADRPKLAKDKMADVFVSIHCNSVGNKAVRGTETLIRKDGNVNTAEDRGLADRVQSGVVGAVGQNDRGVKTGNYRVLSDASLGNTATLHMTRSCLAEIDFISNDTFEQWIKVEANQQAVAKAIVDAVVDDLENQP